ncbi:MAG: outer membrane protein assembly factor BamA [Mariprofundaceae bacterium]|nr:outer membrane protein assembly factor BamA [Mariprofundaceae bacterium]
MKLSMDRLNILFLGFFVLFFTQFSWAETTTSATHIVSIVVQGNHYVETAAVKAKIKSKVGQELNRRTMSRDVRRLFATGYFSDVSIEGNKVKGGIELVYMVQENPVIASVKIEGNEEIPDKKLKPSMKMKPGLILSARVERLDTNSIRKAYLNKGFYQMGVQIETQMLDDGRVDVVVNVDEGDVTYIKDIRFVGNVAFSDEELRQPLASSTSDFGSWFTSRDVFNRERFAADTQLLLQFYQDQGHLDAQVESARLMLTPDKANFYLALSIFEGPAYTVSTLDLRGDIVPSREVLLESMLLEEGKLYSVDKLRQSIHALTEAVGDEGFAFANVTPLFQRNIENNTVAISFDIEKGREVYVERVQISGNSKTQDHVIRRELRQYEGERYSASDVRRSKERLRRMRYIENIRVSTPLGSTDDHINMHVDIEEGKSGTFSAGVTYSELQSLSFTGKVEEQNLFGQGYQANVSADVGGATNNYTVSLLDPYFLNEDMSASVSVFNTRTDLQSFTSYQKESSGGSVGLGFALSEFSRYSVRLKMNTTTLSDLPNNASAALLAQEGTFSSIEISQSLSYDTRNRTIAANKGGFHAISLSTAGLGGDYKFYELGVSSRSYQPLSEDLTLSYGIKAATIRGYDGVDAPVFRRYSLGGAGSLRGYSTFGVSLRDPNTQEILGGEHRVTTSLEVLFPLPYMGTAGFRGAFFVDTGTVWGESGQVNEVFDAAKIRASYGFGIEWISPIGPIAMVWATAVNAQEGDQINSFEFALGQGF